MSTISFFKSHLNIQPLNELYSEFIEKLQTELKIPVETKLSENTKIILAHGFGILNALLECEIQGRNPMIISLDGSQVKNENYRIHTFRYIRNIKEDFEEEMRHLIYQKNLSAIVDSENYDSCEFYTDERGHYAFFYNGEVYEKLIKKIGEEM